MNRKEFKAGESLVFADIDDTHGSLHLLCSCADNIDSHLLGCLMLLT